MGLFNKKPKYKKTYSLTTGTKLSYDGTDWYKNGNKMSLAEVKGYRFKTPQGYWKGLDNSGNLKVLDLDPEGKPIKAQYIGGTTQEARDKYWKQAPIMSHAVDSVANLYGVNPESAKKRIESEGYVDAMINENNGILLHPEFNKHRNPRDNMGYAELHSDVGHGTDGFVNFGLDDVHTYIDEGKVKPRNERYSLEVNTNEEGRLVNTARGKTTLDNIGLTAATLKYFTDLAKSKYPYFTQHQQDVAGNTMYNRGADGGTDYIKTHGVIGTNYDFKTKKK